MPIEFNCEYCQQMIRVPDESVGHQARCPFCQNVQPVPNPSESAGPPQAASFGSNPYEEASPYADRSSEASRDAQGSSSPGVGPQASSSFSPSTPPPPPPGTPYASEVPAPPAPPGSPPPPPLANPYRQGPAEIQVLPEYMPNAKPFAERMNLASHGDRFLGAVIDYLFCFVCVSPSVALWSMASTNANQTLREVAAVLFLIGMIINAAVQAVLISKRAQSVGKIVVNTKIITQSGAEPGFVHGVLLRNWLMSLLFGLCLIFMCFCYPLSPLLLVVDGLLILGERRQCLHDMLASTFVVSDRVS